MDGQQRKQLQDALLNAFPTIASLEHMLEFGLTKNFRQIAGEGSLEDRVFELIQKADSQGWVEDLVRAAQKENPKNELLKTTAKTLFSNHEIEKKYEKGERISKGIYTEVYMGKNRDLDRTVVIKKLHYKELRKQFRKTIKDALDISNLCNFITIYDFNCPEDSKDCPYYVMQFLKGRTLRYEIKNRQKIPYKNAIEIFLKIGKAIIQARKILGDNYYYLNIKPSNIMLDKDNEPFISAFNLCVNFTKTQTIEEFNRVLKMLNERKEDLKDKEYYENFYEKCQEQLAYLIPEKFKDNNSINQQSDQYMLGLLAYELLTGKIPPSIKDMDQVLSNNISIEKSISNGEAFQPISFHDNEVDSEYPVEIKDIIIQMIDLDPKNRFPSLKEALDSIEISDRFRCARKTINIVKDSFIKCINTEKNPSFFKIFYDKFIDVPGVSEKFSKQDDAFWENHHKFVEKAILLLFWYYEEEKIFGSIKTPATDEKFNFLDSIVKPHTNLNISDELFNSFRTTLIESVIEYNDEGNEEIYKKSIKSAWEEVLEPGFEYIKSKYKNIKSKFQNEKVSQQLVVNTEVAITIN